MFDQAIYIKKRYDQYQRNLRALKKSYPQYVAKVEQQKLFVDFHLMPTGTNNEINVYSVKNDCFLYDIQSPLDGIAEDFKSFKQSNVTFAILMGLGLGYELQYFAESILTKNKILGFILVQNQVELFKLSLYIFDYVSLFNYKNLCFILSEKPEDIFLITQKYIQEDNGRLVIFLSVVKNFYYTNIIKTNNAYYLEAMRKINEAIIYALDNYGNSPQDSLIGISNMFSNIKEIINNPGINLLYNKFKNKPAIIVSAGPSLNKNKHFLKGIEDNALIIAPDSSLKILKELGVLPHMITSLERTGRTHLILDGFSKEDVKDVYLAACPVVPPNVYETYLGPRIIVYRQFDHFKWLNIDRGMLDVKHSSGNMAYKLADALGCDPIILIGQDLAYSDDGTSHATGTTLGEHQYNIKENSFEIPGNCDKTVLTNSSWYRFLKSYEIDIAKSNSHCINATEGGAYINGTEVMNFNDAIKKYIKKPIYALDSIKQMLASFGKEQIEKDKDNFINICKNTSPELNIFKEKAQKGIDYIELHKAELENMLRTQNFNDSLLLKHQEEIKVKARAYFRESKIFQLLLVHSLQSSLIKFENDTNLIYDEYPNPLEALAHDLLAQKKWFEITLRVVEITEIYLQEAYQKMLKSTD